MNQTVLGYAAGLVNGDLAKFGKRWYDPNVGRFNRQDSLDTIGDPQRGNRYAHATCDPVSRVDPTGMIDEGNIGAATALVFCAKRRSFCFAAAAATGGAPAAATVAMLGAGRAGALVGGAVGSATDEATELPGLRSLSCPHRHFG
ncbi:RHS repeat-associated core domain-containing protein [Actinoplanes sp. NPDC049802]|uniref:RHS repeat-associated core domain-containing protein n=1 Tax=Actinoplanes sp. NPDC049802 TaxID=3154742 RepID=UPI0033DA29F3